MTHTDNPDPTVTETLRKLQSRVQVWVKPTDRILTDADAYEYDKYRAEKTSDQISFHWGLSLIIFGILAGSLTYYACFLIVSGRFTNLLGVYGGEKWYFQERGVGGLVSAMGFHLFVFPGFAMFMGNARVKKVCKEIVGYCLLAILISGLWWWVVFGGKGSECVLFIEFRPFKVSFGTK